eukprot:Gb_38267 [translate_table: standard]
MVSEPMALDLGFKMQRSSRGPGADLLKQKQLEETAVGGRRPHQGSPWWYKPITRCRCPTGLERERGWAVEQAVGLIWGMENEAAPWIQSQGDGDGGRGGKTQVAAAVHAMQGDSKIIFIMLLAECEEPMVTEES